MLHTQRPGPSTSACVWRLQHLSQLRISVERLHDFLRTTEKPQALWQAGVQALKADCSMPGWRQVTLMHAAHTACKGHVIEHGAVTV